MSKQSLFIAITLLSFMLITCSVSANNFKTIKACELKHQTPNELSQCFDLVIKSVDRELQTWINNQVFVLEEFAIETGRRSALAMFKRSQRNFITYRENNCRWQYLHISPDVRAAPTYKKCYILTTKGRIEELARNNP